jgi:predicted MFS family arabinose efflux permease
MTSNVSATADSLRRKRQIVGAIAVILIAILFVLLFFGLDFIIWIALVAVVWLGANFALKKMKKQQENL